MDACYVIDGWIFTRIGDETSHKYRVTTPSGMLDSYESYFSSVADMREYIKRNS